MGKKLRDEDLHLNIIVNGKKGTKELNNLEVATKELTNQNKQLRLEKKKLEVAGKKETQEYRNIVKAIKENNVAIDTNKQKMSALRKQIGLNSLTMAQLKKEATSLRIALNNTTPGTAEWKRLNAELTKTELRMRELKGGAKKTGMSLKDMLVGGGIIGGAVLLANKIGSLVTGFLDIAQSLEQTEKRAKIVFGLSFPALTRAAQENARAMKMTRNEYKLAATNVADLMVPLDFTREQSAEIAIGLTNLSGALDEWLGGMHGAAGVSEILTKAMLGENEQLKQLGIAIRKDSDEFRNLVKQKLADTDMTKAQAEAMATYELILKKSKDAQTAFAQEGDNLLRKRKSWGRFWRQLKEDAVSYFTGIGDQFAYFGDTLELTWRNIKKASNEMFGTEYDIEPLENFTNSIIHADSRFMDFAKTIETFGMETEEGKTAAAKLGLELQKWYGDEGMEVYKTYIKEQTRLMKGRIVTARLEEEDIAETKKKAQEKAFQEELAKNAEDAMKKAAARAEQFQKDLQAQIQMEVEGERQKKQILKELEKAMEEEMAIQDEMDRDMEMEYELERYQETLEGKKTLLEAALKNEEISYAEYYDKIEALDRKAMLEQVANREKIGNASMDILGSVSTFFEAQKNKELEAAGDNADKREEIEKKFARKQQDIAVTQAMIRGALAIQRIAADVPKVDFGITTALMIGAQVALTAAQVALIKTQQFAAGKYDVLGAGDGQRYSANFVGRPRTGLYDQPSLGLFSEKEPEIVIDGPTTRNIQLNYPEIMQAINHARVPQYAGGSYASVEKTTIEKQFTDPEMLSAISTLNTLLSKGIRAYSVMSDFKEVEQEYNDTLDAVTP